MAATVMSPDGTWSGAVGKADRVRDVRVDDQFAIGSVTKSLVAAQVMQMVEAGEFALDDPVTDHLPPDLDFDTNGATIRQLLGHLSGIPDYYPAVETTLSTDPLRVWKTADLLDLVPAARAPAGESFEYSDTNYLLLGLAVEQVRGRPMAEVLRDGVLDIEGVERLIYPPDEVPTEPMAMPDGKSSTQFKKHGGYLPSIAGSTSDGPGGAMASDAPSLARWWRAFCAGEIVSQDSLTEMATSRQRWRVRTGSVRSRRSVRRGRGPYRLAPRVRGVGRMPAGAWRGRRRAAQPRGRGHRRDGPPPGGRAGRSAVRLKVVHRVSEESRLQ